jgi:uncharacterized protein YuzE
MRIIYDANVDALYVRLVDKKTKVVTQRLTEDIAVNYGPKGDVVGIEILSAHEHLKFSGHKPTLETENLTVV